MNLKLNELFRQKNYWFIVIVCFGIFYIPLFYNLDGLVLRVWDESRNAVNATEMLANKNLLIRQYDGSPDMWEAKPPLLIWLQSTGINHSFIISIICTREGSVPGFISVCRH